VKNIFADLQFFSWIFKILRKSKISGDKYHLSYFGHGSFHLEIAIHHNKQLYIDTFKWNFQKNVGFFLF